MVQSKLGPMFKQIKEDIVEDIISSVYRPGDKLPTQEEYARKYGVSRLTVRKAMDDLILKGILRAEKGCGTFVQEIVANTYSYRRLAGFTSNVASQKVKVTSRVLGISELQADKRLATKLNIELGAPVILLERLRFGNGVCMSLQRSFIVKELTKNIDFFQEDMEKESLYQLLREKAGLYMEFADECFRAIRATAQLAEYFEVEEGDPVFLIYRVTHDVKNRPVEYCEEYSSSDVNGVWVKTLNI